MLCFCTKEIIEKNRNEMQMLDLQNMWERIPHPSLSQNEF